VAAGGAAGRGAAAAAADAAAAGPSRAASVETAAEALRPDEQAEVRAAAKAASQVLTPERTCGLTEGHSHPTPFSPQTKGPPLRGNVPCPAKICANSYAVICNSVTPWSNCWKPAVAPRR